MFSDGFLYLDRKQYRDAAACFEKAVEQNPEDLSAVYWLGVAKAGLGDNDESALECFVRAVQEPRLSHAARHQAALIYLRRHQYSVAEEMLQAALVDRPGWPPALIALAQAFVGQWRLGDAAVAAQIAIAAAPDDPASHNVLGTVLFRQRDFVGAEEAFSRQVACAPDDASGVFGVARAQIAQGKDAEAMLTLNRAISMVGSLPKAELRLALLQRKAGHWADVEAILRRCLMRAPDHTTLLVMLARALFERGDANGALAMVRPIVATKENVPRDAVLVLAQVLLQAGSLVRADRHIQRMLAAYPDWLEARLLHASLLIAQDKAEAAEDLILDVLSKRQNSLAALYLYCDLLAAEDRIEEAAARLERRLQTVPLDRKVRDWLALAYTKEGRGSDAQRLLAGDDVIVLTPLDEPSTEPAKKPVEYVGLAENSAFLPTGMSLTGDINPNEKMGTSGMAPRSFLTLLSQRPGVIYALMIQEMSLRFAERRLGYLWALISPLMFITVLSLIFTLVRHRQPAGMSLPLFLLTGLMMWQAFQGVQNGAAAVIRKRNTLSVPRITFIDYLLAVTVLELLTQMCVGLIFILAMTLLRIDVPMPNVPKLFAVFGALYMTGIGYGTLLFSLKRQFPIILEFNRFINRVMFFSSGIFFSIANMPSHIAYWIWFNPVMHVVELSRQAFIPHFPVHNVTILYPLGFGVFGFLFGVLIHRRLSAAGQQI